MTENDKVFRNGGQITYLPDDSVTDAEILRRIDEWCRYFANANRKGKYEQGYKEACKHIVGIYEHGLLERNGGTVEVTFK